MRCSFVVEFVPDVWRGRMHYWSHSGKVGVPIEYDGVPFMHVGRWSLICHQGRDIAATAKSKYLEKKKKQEQEGMRISGSRKASTKKVNCPAEIYVSHIIKYPQFKVSPRLLTDNSLPSEQIRKTNKEKLRLLHRKDPGKVVRLHCYYVRLPQPGDHQGHPFVAHVAADDEATNLVVSNTSTLDRRKINKNRDRHRRTREPLDARVGEKLADLIREGYCSTAVIRSELNKFVIQELFAGEVPPPAMFRRYNPTSRDIQNALHKVKQEAYESHRTELRSLCSSALSNIDNALSSVDDEVTLSNMYKHLTHLCKQFGIGSNGRVSTDCSVSVHQVSSEETTTCQVVTVIEESQGRFKEEVDVVSFNDKSSLFMEVCDQIQYSEIEILKNPTS